MILFATLFACAPLTVSPGGAQVSDNTALVQRIDASLTKAARYLIRRQAPDGAWRSETYGNMKDGSSLTPTVLNTLYFLPQGGDDGKKAFQKGVDYLVGYAGPDGRIKPSPFGLDYPVLTAGPACRVISLTPSTPTTTRALKAWLDYALERRLGPKLGWQTSDPEFGGWGFYTGIPRKPATGQAKPPLVESNLVATIFGLLSLRSAKAPLSDPVYGEILELVKRCQNFSDKPEEADPNYDDGGFFFIPGDVVQNKAGGAGKDRLGRERFVSYGSMTADGIRALIRCGLQADHPRVLAARRWLERNFSAAEHPGDFQPDRAVLRDGTYYYYVWAVAHAFLALGAREIESSSGKVNWTQRLAEEILKRQRVDGSWVNRFTASREDDPLIATPLAASSLAICRQMLVSADKVTR